MSVPVTTSVPLSRNRDYQLLWISRTLSEVGSNATLLVLPLLALEVTGSAVLAGLTTAVHAGAQVVAGLPAGALADRWPRKTVMLGVRAAGAVALASLVVAMVFGTLAIGHLLAASAVLGICQAMFEPAEEASLPHVVGEDQLTTAVAMNGARAFVGHLAGRALGGVLFGLRRVLPFLADLVIHIVSFVLLLFVRLPARAPRVASGGSSLRHEVLTGVKWVWRHKQIRAIAATAVGIGLLFQGVYLVVVVVATQRGVPPGEIGVMAAMVGVGGLLGAALAPRLLRVISPYVSIIAVLWAFAVLMPILSLLDNGYLMGAVFAGMMVLGPTANTTITTYQLLLTPDELRGRVSGLVGLLAGAAASIGPVAAGALVEIMPGPQAILLCSLGVAVIALVATCSPSLRAFGRTDGRNEKPDGGDPAHP